MSNDVPLMSADTPRRSTTNRLVDSEILMTALIVAAQFIRCSLQKQGWNERCPQFCPQSELGKKSVTDTHVCLETEHRMDALEDGPPDGEWIGLIWLRGDDLRMKDPKGEAASGRFRCIRQLRWSQGGWWYRRTILKVESFHQSPCASEERSGPYLGIRSWLRETLKNRLRGTILFINKGEITSENCGMFEAIEEWSCAGEPVRAYHIASPCPQVHVDQRYSFGIVNFVLDQSMLSYSYSWRAG